MPGFRHYCIIILLLLSSAGSYGQQKIVKTFSARTFYEDNGLLSNNIHAAAQHSSGEIWFGTAKGISTFDGLRWSEVPGSENFPFYHRSMLVSLPGDSMLQLGLVNRTQVAVRLYHQDTATDLARFNLSNNFSNHRVFNAAAQQDSLQLHIALQLEENLWLYKSASKGWNKVALPAELLEATITKLIYYKGALVIATTKGLYSLQLNSEKIQQLWPSLIENQTVLSATTSPDGEKLYLLGSNWVAEWHSNRLRFIEQNLLAQKTPFLPSANYNIVAKQAGLLVLQIDHSLFLLNPQTGFLEPFRLTNSFANTTPSAILEDSEQNLWFTTLRGVAMLNSLRFATMDKVVGLPDSEISTIFQVDSGTVLLGGNLGVNILKDYRWQRTVPGERTIIGNTNYRIMDAISGPQEQIYIAGNNLGVGVLEKDLTLQWHPLPDGLLATSISLWQGNPIIGTNLGKIMMLREGTILPFLDLEEHNYIRKMYLDKEGKLLVLTPRGLYAYDGRTAPTALPSTNNKAGDNLYSAVEAYNTTLLGTGNGLYALKNGEIYSLKDSIAVERPIYAMLIDKRGSLWMGTDKGVYVYHDNKLINYNRFNGLTGHEINRSALVEMKDDRIWIGTDRGLSIYDPHYDFERTLIPRLQLKEIRANDQPLAREEDYQLAADQNTLEFTFQSLSFYYPEATHFRYKLEGLDTDWTYSKNHLQNNVRYNSLPGGQYRFAIQASIQDGPWSPTQYSPLLAIAPPFYSSWWFIASVMLGIGLIGYTFRSVITQRSNEKQLKKAIQEKISQIEISESKFQAIWESIDTAVAIVGQDASILMANPSFYKLFAQEGQQPEGHKIGDLLQHSRFAAKAIAEWYAKPHTAHFEMEFIRQDHPLFLLSTFNCLYRFSPGKPLLLIGLKNISDQKEAEVKNLRLNELLVRQNRDLVKKELELATFNMELLKRQEELQAALGVLEERNFELDQFVYKTSHDLRAPIASSLGLLNIMKMEGLSASWPGYIDMIMRSLQKQDSFIKAMLNFSKTARAVEKPEPIVLKSLVEQCFRDLQYLPGFDDIQKHVRDTTSCNCFYSDRMKVHIILSNIISNSIKYRDASKASVLDITIETSTDWAQIQVSDNGIGINKKYLEHIFDMFYRATERSDGSGLGLYIVKQTVERLGGKIEVSSELGVGSCFKIRIPNLVAKVVDAEKDLQQHSTE